MSATHQNYPTDHVGDGWTSRRIGDYFIHTKWMVGEIWASASNAYSIEAVAFNGSVTTDLRWFDSVTEAKAAVLAAHDCRNYICERHPVVADL